jgi:hypothetical protein
MKINLVVGEECLVSCLEDLGFPHAQFAGATALWLEACGYPGLKHLHEGLSDAVGDFKLTRDVLGIDLNHVSCARIGPDIVAEVLANGRAFLRNVRHGLFLLPASVEHNIGIGCPIDPGFALGGERTKNPYVEKLDAAKRDGFEVDDALWQSLTQRS